MKDTTKKLVFPENRAAQIVGKTRIELTSVKTGEKKILESKNTFQSTYLTRFLRSFGKSNASMFNNETWAGRPLWRNLVGGIFLFRDQITAPAEYMPAGNLMVGNGAYGVSNSSIPTELGSYNEIESATGGTNSLTFVYDWGTSQANGTIGCICLTSETGGYIGYGNASGGNASPRSLTAYQDATRLDARFYYNGKAYRVTDVDLDNKKITIAVGTDAITQASIFQGQDETVTEYTYTGDVIGDSTAGSIFVRAISNTEFAIIRGKAFGELSIASGASGAVLVFNASTNTLGKQTITNTSGGSLAIIPAVSDPAINMTKDETGNVYIAQTTGDDTKLLQFNSSGVYQGAVAPGKATAAFGRLTEDLIGSQQTTGQEPMYIFDGTTARITNGYMAQNMGAQTDYSGNYDALFYSPRAAAAIGPYRNPLYLATINNLESAITKDSTQTMKVIYTLTEASS